MGKYHRKIIGYRLKNMEPTEEEIRRALARTDRDHQETEVDEKELERLDKKMILMGQW